MNNFHSKEVLTVTLQFKTAKEMEEFLRTAPFPKIIEKYHHYLLNKYKIVKEAAENALKNIPPFKLYE